MYFFSPDPPENIEISENVIVVEEGESPEKLLCTAEAYPQANYFWKFNGDTVATDNLLFFDKGITRYESGEYTCIAQNRHGASQIKTNFDVRCKSSLSQWGRMPLFKAKFQLFLYTYDFTRILLY